MMNLEQGNKPNMDGVNLLVSILVCYPEIGTLSYDPADDSLKMTFILGKKPEGLEMEAAEELLRQSILSYHALEGLQSARINIKTNQYGEIVFLNIVRDMETMSKGEIALVSTLIKDRFEEVLVGDVNIAGAEDEGMIQEDFIDNMIGSMKLTHAAEKLIGIREDGRVMVFNK